MTVHGNKAPGSLRISRQNIGEKGREEKRNGTGTTRTKVCSGENQNNNYVAAREKQATTVAIA